MSTNRYLSPEIHAHHIRDVRLVKRTGLWALTGITNTSVTNEILVHHRRVVILRRLGLGLSALECLDVLVYYYITIQNFT